MTDSPLASAEWAALVGAVRFNPDDDTPRLVAADWLQETDRPELAAWAEFVRHQCVTAARPRLHLYTDSCDCEVCRPERRAALLYDRWAAYWSMNAFPWVDGVRITTPVALKHYARGFPADLTVGVDDWRVREVPGYLPRYFARVPLVSLVAVQTGRGTNPGDRWRLTVRVQAKCGNGRTLLLTVRSEISPEPLRLADRAVSSVRVVGPANRLDRAIGGAVRDAVNNRQGCFRHPPFGQSETVA